MKGTFQILWSQVDPNGHLRHSAYYDLTAQMRVNAFEEAGYTINQLLKAGIGPILFREEARFMKEIHLNETVTADLAIANMSPNGRKWSIQHHIYKQDGKLAATVTVDGAWMDLKLRRVTAPPKDLFGAFDKFPKTEDFVWLEK